jgi:hypothetical protein
LGVDSFDWGYSSGFGSATQYQYSTTGTAGTYSDVTVKPIVIGHVALGVD